VHGDYVTGIPGAKTSNTALYPTTKSYVGINVDYFGNNSLGIGLEQRYTLDYSRYIRGCGSGRLFSSIGIGAGYMNQRLYSTRDKADSGVIPMSAQISYLIPGSLKECPVETGQSTKVPCRNPPKLIVRAQAGYLASFTDPHAYQAYANGSLQIPTPFNSVAVTLADTDMYINNSPDGHKRNYQNGSASLVFSWVRDGKNAKPTDLGACYGSDPTKHLYCYDQAVRSDCAAPSVFTKNAQCSSPSIPATIQAVP
jgi:hypothetical protein